MITSVLLAVSLAAIAPDGYRLEEASQCFTMYRMTEQGEAKFGNTLQTVELVEHDGAPALRIVVHQYGDNGIFSMRDEFLLTREDLKPIEFNSHFTSKRGQSRDVELHYADESITGSKTANGKTTEIDLPLQSPIWEGTLWGLTFAAMPLQRDAHFVLPYYQYDKGFGKFEIDVIGSETVTTPDGPVEAWVLKAGITGVARSRYFIAKESAAELGYEGEGFRQALGGDCSHIPHHEPVP